MPLRVKVKGKDDLTEVTLKNVLWAPEIPCRILSTGTIRRDGGEFIDSSTKDCYLRFKKDEPRILLDEKKGFLVLQASLRTEINGQASAHASFANKKQRLTLKQWHDTLGHIDPAAIKHLEKRGLVNITDTTVASDMRCSVSVSYTHLTLPTILLV